MGLSITMTKEEEQLAESYAKLQNLSLADTFKLALFDRIEHEMDLQIFSEYEQEKEAGTLKTYSHDEVWKEFE